jgi:hypothetical protein
MMQQQIDGVTLMFAERYEKVTNLQKDLGARSSKLKRQNDRYNSTAWYVGSAYYIIQRPSNSRVALSG